MDISDGDCTGNTGSNSFPEGLVVRDKVSKKEERAGNEISIFYKNPVLLCMIEYVSKANTYCIFICEFAYSRWLKIYQNLIFANICHLPSLTCGFWTYFGSNCTKSVIFSHTVLPRNLQFQNLRCFDKANLPWITRAACIVFLNQHWHFNKQHCLLAFCYVHKWMNFFLKLIICRSKNESVGFIARFQTIKYSRF